ncbi:MAG: OmpA family protein [bacterium]|nr:OmpA family protein [bacterium]
MNQQIQNISGKGSGLGHDFPRRPSGMIAGILLLAISAALAPACVSQSKYDDLTARLNERENELANLSKERSMMATALSDFESRNAQADARIQEYNALIQRFQKLIDAGKLKIKIVDGRMVVELPSDILFASAQATLSRDGHKSIREIAAVLAEVPDRKYQVEGHTDDWPIQTVRYRNNWELAAARAITVVRTMIDTGLAPERVSAAGYGDTRPVGDNETQDGRAQNRRIEIVIVPDLSGLPGFNELNEIDSAEQRSESPAVEAAETIEAGN